MPVRYDIAAGVPQQQSGGMDPLNAFATMQAMSYRQQQNALAQAQLEEYQRQRQEEEGLRNYMAQQGVDPMSEEFMRRVAGISPKYLTGLMSARAAAERDLALRSEARSRIDQAERRLGAEMPGIQAKSRKEQLDKALAEVGMAREMAMGVLQTGEGYDKLKEFIKDSPWSSMLGPKPDSKQLRALATQASTFQEMLKPNIREIDKEIVQVEPGVAGGAPVVRPAVVQAPPLSTTTEDAAEPQFKGRLIPPEEIPAARAPVTQRQYREAPAREQATSIFKDLRNQYEKLYERGGMAGEGQSLAQRTRNVLAGTPAGQQVARISDPKSQAIRDVIDKTIDQYIETKRAAGSISAQEANTMDELVRLKSMLGSPTFDIDAVREILANADKYSGTGELFKQFQPTEQERKGVIDGRKLQADKPPISSFYRK